MSLAPLLDADSIAVIGASKNETKRGFQSIRTLLEAQYEGAIYPVNPKEKSILGLRCYPDISAIEGSVDLGLICTPARTLPGILKACGQKRVKGVVVLAGGFGELGPEGRYLEGEMVRVAREHQIRIIGPNTSGMMNLKKNMNLVGLKEAPRGDIALLTQSGNMALTLITEAKVKSRKGFSYYVGVGNEADVAFHEYLNFFGNDPDTRAILMYVEGMRKGRAFLQEAYMTTQKKPVVLLKSGRSSTGKRSAGSHTGALAGMSRVARSAFERAGIIVIENSDELFPAAEALSSLPPIRNGKVAILADGGGHATIAADLLTDLGIQIPILSDKTQAKLRNILPAAASLPNPVDVAGGTDSDPTVFAACADIILQDPEVGGLLIVGLFGGYGIRFAESLAFMEEDAAHQMGKMVQAREKPIVLHSLYASVKPHALDLLRYYGIPVYDSLDIGCTCIGVLAQYGDYLASFHEKADFVFNWRQKAKSAGADIIAAALAAGRKALLESEAKALLALHGIPVPQEYLVQSAEEAADTAKKIPEPVAMKIVSPDILHKSDAKGVKLNVRTKEEARRAYREIIRSARDYNPKADIKGVLVTPMAAKGVEVIIGTKEDDQFGPVIMFGLGGVLVEILQDVAFRVLPISPLSAKNMITEIKSARLLNRFRGGAASDKKALQKLLLKCSELVEAYPEIKEMDLNPVIAHERGCSVVDARIILNDTPRQPFSTDPTSETAGP
ncbi:MAG: acetate--CoA ligase family protein [Desulfobacterales bacterium]